MNTKSTLFQLKQPLGGKPLVVWRSLQGLVWLVGLSIFLSLIFFPKLGIAAFWNVLIPVAPALFVLAIGIWRNVCPLATVAMLPHHFNFSKKKRLPLKWQGRLSLVGVSLLFLIVPLRHLMLNNDGLSTAITLAFLATLAFVGGIFFDSKSGWCSSLCPVHPVEKLYGQNVFYSPPNAHCGQCHNCVSPCPDSTPKMNPHKSTARSSHRLAATILTGGLPGFIWGWFHVPDCKGLAVWRECIMAFGLPWAAMLLTLGAFVLLRHFLAEKWQTALVSVFAAASVSCYYWFRLPSLVGYGLFPGDGMLVDLTQVVPAWSLILAQVAAVVFFGWWLIFRKAEAAVWAVRPPFLERKK